MVSSKYSTLRASSSSAEILASKLAITESSAKGGIRQPSHWFLGCGSNIIFRGLRRGESLNLLYQALRGPGHLKNSPIGRNRNQYRARPDLHGALQFFFGNMLDLGTHLVDPLGSLQKRDQGGPLPAVQLVAHGEILAEVLGSHLEHLIAD